MKVRDLKAALEAFDDDDAVIVFDGMGGPWPAAVKRPAISYAWAEKDKTVCLIPDPADILRRR